jgi:predicted metal-dependent HD superfamily phosphohydrolase
MFENIDTSWSKLNDTSMSNYVFDIMNSTGREYHNANHVATMWQHAKKLGLEYDPTLDAAILWHDVVYDAESLKELRSAEKMRSVARLEPVWFSTVDVAKAAEMIMTTDSHKYVPEADMRLVHLDLMDLTIPSARYVNFWNIMSESRCLYKVNTRKAAGSSEEFMKGFVLRMQQNAVEDLENDDFWEAVAEGAKETILMAQVVQDLYEYN